MYINSVDVRNIRAIEDFQMVFEEGKQAGWHVIIGENGAGKSTIVKAIALAIIGPYDSKALRLNLAEWVRKLAQAEGSIELMIKKHEQDGKTGQSRTVKTPISAKVILKTGRSTPYLEAGSDRANNYIWSNASGWFSSAFGPFRRFTGGEKDWMKVYYSDPRAAAHLSVFGEDVALTEAIDWLKQLNYKKLERSVNQSLSLDVENELIDYLILFLNNGGLLPHGSKLHSISSEGVFFVDGNDRMVDVTQMSDGYRSILSLTFELIRQLVRAYSVETVFKSFNAGDYRISLPGVVLVDEIDAHLHPTWQATIGDWFTRVFPQIQFIVTTHSPLICRAAENGSIWRLKAPGSEQVSGEVIGTDKDRLLYGDLLDAYGTELFGRNITQSQSGQKLTEDLAKLNMASFKRKLKPTEKAKLEELKTITSNIADVVSKG